MYYTFISYPSYQIYEHWDELMSYYVNRRFVDRDTVLVGHSCGAVFIVKYVLQHKLNIKGMLTFSGYNNFISGNEMMDNLNISFYMDDNNLRDIKKYANKVFAFNEDDDPNIPQQILHDYAEKLVAIEQCVPKAGHFNSSAGYNTCDLALDTILKEFT